MANTTGKKHGGREKGVPNKSTQNIKNVIDGVVNFEYIIKKLLELSNGVMAKNDQGIIYNKPPDTAAIKILMEYRFGKPRQELSIETPVDSTLTLEIIRKATPDANK